MTEMADDAGAEQVTMADVDHESPDGTGADLAFERGTEGKDETV